MNDIKTKRALDRALISLGSGDADSLEAVYELSARRLYSVCYLITGNREDAEDALHNAMLRICRYAPDYKSQNGALGKSLDLTDDGGLLWKVEVIEGESTYSPATSAFSIISPTLIYDYVFSNSGELDHIRATGEKNRLFR